jgi:hypothetical protein
VSCKVAMVLFVFVFGMIMHKTRPLVAREEKRSTHTHKTHGSLGGGGPIYAT